MDRPARQSADGPRDGQPDLGSSTSARGIVRTPSNFGKLGEPPSDPDLLDYLARRFVASGWSIKAMHRLIMNSAAYQQSASALARAAPASTPRTASSAG